MPPNLALNAEASGDEPGGQPGGSGTRLGANPPDPAAATSLAVSGVNAGDGGAAAAQPASIPLRSDTAPQPYDTIESVLDGASSLYARFGQGGPPNPAAAVTSDNALYSAEQAMDRLIRTWRTLAPTTSGSPLGSISPA
jgi:hypothetical protein